MKKMKLLMRLVGISLALLLLFTASACNTAQAEEEADMKNENVNSKESDTTENAVEIPCEGYTLSLEGTDLVFRYDDSVIHQGEVTNLGISEGVTSSIHYPVKAKEDVVWFLSNVLICERIQLTPTTWDSFECTSENPAFLNWNSVSFNSEIELSLWFQDDGQLIVMDAKTEQVYCSEPDVVDLEKYYRFLYDFDWTVIN